MKQIEWRSCLRIVASVFLLYLCITYWPNVSQLIGLILGAALPLLMGCITAYIINILMSFYERHFFPKSNCRIYAKVRRPVCMLGAFLTLVVIVSLICYLVIPQLISCVSVLLSGVPGVLQNAVDFIDSLGILPETIIDTLSGIDWKTKIDQIIQVLTTGVGNAVGAAVTALTSVFSWITSGLMSLIFSIYLLMGKENLGRQCKKVANHYLKRSWIDKISYVIGVFNDSFHRFIVGQCLEAVILGTLCALGMTLLKLPYAAMIGALMSFTALIPVAGAWIGGIVGAIMILTESPIQAVIFVIFILVLQQLENNLIYPRVVGSSMGLPAVWVFTAVTIGGGILGITGMLLGVPFAAALYRIIQEDVNKELLPSTERTNEQI